MKEILHQLIWAGIKISVDCLIYQRMSILQTPQLLKDASSQMGMFNIPLIYKLISFSIMSFFQRQYSSIVIVSYFFLYHIFNTPSKTTELPPTPHTVKIGGGGECGSVPKKPLFLMDATGLEDPAGLEQIGKRDPLHEVPMGWIHPRMS